MLNARPDPAEAVCPRLPEAGTYLLGALSPGERAAYAAHLEFCQQCLREVGQLAGLPGLLGRGADLAAWSAAPSAVTATLPTATSAASSGAASEPLTGPAARTASTASADFPARPDPVAGALRDLRRARQRGRALVAAAFVLVAGLGLASAGLGGGTDPGTGVVAAAELPVRMEPVDNAPVSAAVSLAARPWGTEVVMRCRYSGPVQSPVYVLIARSADGTASEIARWSAVNGQEVVLAAATELSGPRLAELEVRNAAGAVVLRAEQLS
ncbi:MAG: hypothetical protein ACT4O0_10200 [Pseudonocardia sp.]